MAKDCEEELSHSECSSQYDASYQLPDGKVVKIGRERFQCTEALFDPSLIGILSA